MATATKQDFRRAAERVKFSGLDVHAKNEMVAILVNIFNDLSGRFDETKFRAACGQHMQGSVWTF